jgi:4'-phosphopantetheinyl transferase
MLFRFCFIQCLKESYVKALGIGVGLSLDRLTCCVTSPLTSARIVDDTKILVDGQIDFNTRFEESLLDDGHAVSVALKQVCYIYTAHSHHLLLFN